MVRAGALALGEGLGDVFSLISEVPDSSIPSASGQVTGKMEPGPSQQGMEEGLESVR